MLRVAPLHVLVLLLLSSALLAVFGVPLPIQQIRPRSGPLFLPEKFAINSGGKPFGNFTEEAWPWITGRTSAFSVDDDFPIGGRFLQGERQAYVSHRYGLKGAPWGYNLPFMVPGVYDCALLFAETHAPNFDAGKRIFDATIQNQTQESIDVMKELNGAEFTALVRRWHGLKVYGWLEVRFEARRGDAFLAAISCTKTADFVDQADLDKVKEAENQLFFGQIVQGIGPVGMNPSTPDPSPSASPDELCDSSPNPTPVVQPSVSPTIPPAAGTPYRPYIIGYFPDRPEPTYVNLLEPDEPQITDEDMLMESPEMTEEVLPTESPELSEETIPTEEPDVPGEEGYPSSEAPPLVVTPPTPPVETPPLHPLETPHPETHPPETPHPETHPPETSHPETHPPETHPPETSPLETPPLENPPSETPPPETPHLETPPTVGPIPSRDPPVETADEEFLQPFELHVSSRVGFPEDLKHELMKLSAESTDTMPSKWAMTNITRSESPSSFIVDVAVALSDPDGQRQYDAYIRFIDDQEMSRALHDDFPETKVTLLSRPEFARVGPGSSGSNLEAPGVNVGAIIGGVAGGILVLLAFALMVFGPGFKKRRDSRVEQDFDSSPPGGMTASDIDRRSREVAKRNTSRLHSMENFENDSTFTPTTSQVESIDVLHLDTDRDLWGRGSQH